MTAYRLKITLRDCEPECTRILRIPRDITFEDLERAIQIAFEWSGGHAGMFYVADADRYICDPELGIKKSLKPGSNKVSKFAKSPMTYTYDMGDSWEHDLVFLSNANNDVVSPKIESLVGPSPPEDCGGVLSYMDYLGPYNDPSSPEHEEAVELFENYNPNPNLEALNERMKFRFAHMRKDVYIWVKGRSS